MWNVRVIDFKKNFNHFSFRLPNSHSKHRDIYLLFSFFSHVLNTASIGDFAILSEKLKRHRVRRLYAVTGDRARQVREYTEQIIHKLRNQGMTEDEVDNFTFTTETLLGLSENRLEHDTHFW